MKCTYEKGFKFVNYFQAQKSFLAALDVDLDHNASDANLLFQHFILGVEPGINGSDPRTPLDLEK